MFKKNSLDSKTCWKKVKVKNLTQKHTKHKKYTKKSSKKKSNKKNDKKKKKSCKTQQYHYHSELFLRESSNIFANKVVKNVKRVVTTFFFWKK